MSTPSLDELSEKVLAGKTPAVARAISWAESADPRFPALLARLHPHGGRARVVGLTGSPGAGKSTLTAVLAKLARAEGKKVGIVAVDPSSPFSGGAILGDRIRMQELYTDPGVLIRSMATRGHLGGLARATADAVDVLDAAGFDQILVETVGVGQDEIEVFRLAETCVVVLTPGMGDDIQAIKAGIMEVADVFVVNKADREGADRVVHEILQMLEMGEHGAWLPPVLKSVARSGEGVPELWETIGRHREHLLGPDGESRRRGRILRRIEGIAQQRLLSQLHGPGREGETIQAAALRVERREIDPIAAAEALLSANGNGQKASTGPIRKISHLGIAVESLDKGGVFYDLLGLGEVHREVVASQKVATSFRPVGDSCLELLEPTAPESPIAGFLAKKGPGIHHLCLEVEDVRAVLGSLKAAGVRLIHEEPFLGAHDCLVAFVHPASTGGVLLELSQPAAHTSS